MTSTRRSALRLALVLATATSLLVAMPASGFFSSYKKPPGGKWGIDSRLDYTKRGVMRINSKTNRITKLVAVIGGTRGDTEACGSRVTLVSKPKMKSYRQFSGRWAVANVRNGLLVRRGVKLKIRGKVVVGKLELIFDRSGRVVEDGTIERGDCFFDFLVRKKKG